MEVVHEYQRDAMNLFLAIIKCQRSGNSTFVGTVLNLYENEVEDLGPGPRRRGGAVVATASMWARAGPLQMAQCRNQN
jgi:hypothetical protein